MKTILKKIALFFLVIIILITVVILRINKVEDNERIKTINESIGLYKLSLSESNLGSYIKDSIRYSKLELKLNEDMSFVFSISTPFIYDSAGIWSAKEVGLYSYNQINYNKNKEFSNQISPCCYNSDRIQMKLPISKDGFEQVDLLVFRKIK